jgi:hypothetical protein
MCTYILLMYVYAYILLMYIYISNIYIYIYMCVCIYVYIGCSQGPQGDGSRRVQHSRGRSIITKPLYY